MKPDYAKVRAGKAAMLKRFMEAKRRAEEAGLVTYKKL